MLFVTRLELEPAKKPEIRIVVQFYPWMALWDSDRGGSFANDKLQDISNKHARVVELRKPDPMLHALLKMFELCLNAFSEWAVWICRLGSPDRQLCCCYAFGNQASLGF